MGQRPQVEEQGAPGRPLSTQTRIVAAAAGAAPPALGRVTAGIRGSQRVGEEEEVERAGRDPAERRTFAQPAARVPNPKIAYSDSVELTASHTAMQSS